MKFSYRLSKICGNVYENGNLIFSSDGTSLLSPVGNRVTCFDLIHHTTLTLPFENKKNIRLIVLSHSNRFLITIDQDGHALLINYPRRVILTRFHFKRKVYELKFSPDDRYFAVTYGRGCQIWKTPNIQKEFSPLVLVRNLTGFHDDTSCLNWSSDSESLIVGSKDLTARVYYRVNSKRMAMSVLTGHRAKILGAFYSSDNEQLYTVAQDGAVFTWQFEYGDRIPVEDKTKSLEDEEESLSDSSDEESENEKESKSEAEESVKKQLTKRGGMWKLIEREFLWDSHTEVCSTAFNSKSNLLVVGFTSGIFGLYSMPGCQNIHKLSVSQNNINSVDINSSGEWLAIGSKSLGQLLVWEWQSESYIIKQQGHMYGLNALDFSSDGMYVATGGEDSKVKVWNLSSGFCFVTFSKHIAPVTGVKFVGKGTGKAVISSSLDGTVRAYDLLRYQNFRTLTTPTPVQLTSLAVDSSGEMVCAGALDPFQIFIWSLQTGKLLDVLSGHEGPIACLTFAQNTGRLASGSWDGTLKLWDIYKNECVETFEHGCDVMAIAFRPDGKEVCTATTNGLLTFWDVESGTQLSTIEGRKDISVGRNSADMITAKNKLKSKYFTSVTYTADGSCVLVGSQSKSVCIYSVAAGTLVKKFELSHNRSLEGVTAELRSDLLVDGVAVDDTARYSDDEEEHSLRHREEVGGKDGIDGSGRDSELLPGAGKGSKNDGSRIKAPEILTSALGFSPTGREWAAATTQGLQIFTLDETIHFAPTDLDMTITPQAIRKAIKNHEYTLAINMALHLAEMNLIKEAVDAVDVQSIPLVVKSIDINMLKRLLRFLADEIATSQHIEYYLKWCWILLSAYGPYLQGADTMTHQESFRALIRAVSVYENDIMRMSDENHFTLEFVKSQGREIFHDFKPNSTPKTTATVVAPNDSNKIIMGYRQTNVKQPSKQEEKEDEDKEESLQHSEVSNSSDSVPQIDVVELVQKIQANSQQTKRNKRKEKEENTEDENHEEEEGEEEEAMRKQKKGKKTIKKLRIQTTRSR